MLDNILLGLSTPSTCGHNQDMQHLVVSERAVPFRQIGHMACIEVVGIPALRCPICDEQIYNLDLLSLIESVLHKRVEQGEGRHYMRSSSSLPNSQRTGSLRRRNEP